MKACLREYLAQSQQIKNEIAQNPDLCEKIKALQEIRFRGDQYQHGQGWHGNFHSVYQLGKLPTGLWVVARVPNQRIHDKVGDLEYCAQKTVEAYHENPDDVVARFCIGVVPKGISYPYQFLKDEGAVLLTEDLSQGGKLTIDNEPDMEYGIIQGTRKKAWYDFDAFDRYVLREKSKNPLFFALENRLEL